MAAREGGVVVSFITDVREVYSAGGAAKYLALYLEKQENEWENLEALGFKRRFSRSHGWPSDEPMRRKGTDVEAWKSHSWTLGISEWSVKEINASVDAPLLERLGGELYLALAAKANTGRLRKTLERIQQIASLP